MRYVGQSTAKLIANHFISYENFKDKMAKIANLSSDKMLSSVDFQDFVAIDGIGEKMAKTIIDYFLDKENFKMIEDLEKQLVIQDTKRVNTGAVSERLYGKTIVFTGTLSKLTRAEAKKQAEEVGMKVMSSVSSKTDFIVAGVDSGSKLKDGKELGIKILNEDEWLSQLA
jgi:DNA ligase (NAD+)